LPSNKDIGASPGENARPATFLRDVVAGAALITIAIAMIWGAQGFPQIRAVAFGPDLFPKIIAGGLILSGLGIGLSAVRDRLAVSPADDTSPAPFAVLPFLAVLAIVAGFALLLPVLGFHVTAALALLASVRVFGGGWTLALIMALIAPVVLHYIFYSLMRVVLPWGILQNWAW
jgi:putative tricarboxylic transport membrane protein